MAEAVKERKDIEEEFKWDLTPIFANDEAWEEALRELDPEFEEIRSCEGTLSGGAGVLKAFLDRNFDTAEKLGTVYSYAAQRKSEDNREEAAQLMISRAMMKYSAYIGCQAWFTPELISLPQETLDSYLTDPLLSGYRHTLEVLLREKEHTLSAEQEAVIAAFSEVSGATGDVAEMIMDADLSWDDITDPESGETVPVNSAGYIPLQMSPDRRIREASFRSFYKGYRQFINTFATTYQYRVKEDALMARLRGYSSSRAMSLAADNIPEQVYDSLIETVHKHLPAMYRYVALRKKLLGLSELHYYDVYAPLVSDLSVSYTYGEAKEMLLETVAPLGEHYTETVRKGLRSRWVDVYPNVGKSSGAYSTGTKKDMPHILMNFSGSLDSVSTLCHEMGHSMHTYLTHEHQPKQYDDYSLFIAEVASTVNENLLIENLLSKNPDPKTEMYLLNQYLENFKGTVYRQCMFAEFEKLAHDRIEAGEALSADGLCAIYKELVLTYFGPELCWDEEIQYEWARIPHFYRSFYVYQYATGYSSAVALSEAIRNDGESAVRKYLEFLSLGSSVDPMDALRHGGVDLSTPEPVDRALRKFEEILSRAEELSGMDIR